MQKTLLIVSKIWHKMPISVSLFFSTTEKPTYIKVLKDGVLYKEFTTPQSFQLSDVEWEFMFGVRNLEPSTSYKLTVEIENISGDTDTTQDIWINTL